MRVFITVSCFLAVASAGYYGGAPAQHAPAPAGQYQGPLHIPVLDHNGVPVEPKEVQEARKSHLAALAAIPQSQDGGYDGQQYDQPQPQQYQQQYNAPQQQYNAPQQQYNAPQQQYNAPQPQYNAPQPQYNAPQQQYQPQQQYRAPQHNQYQQQQQQQQPLPVIDAQGVPQDSPDVAAAKAAHFAAYAEANARTAPAPGPGAGQYGPAPQQPHWH